jgi:hypothetical protein
MGLLKSSATVASEARRIAVQDASSVAAHERESRFRIGTGTATRTPRPRSGHPALRTRFALAAALLALVPTIALAHPGSPAVVHTVKAGPYTLDVMFYAEPRVGQAIPITIRVRGSDGSTLTGERVELRVFARPGLGTDATPVQARIYPDPDNPGLFAADPTVPVVGAWLIELWANGPQGSGTTTIPITVSGPSAIPIWTGWLIGLLPLIGLIWFAWWQWRWLSRNRDRGSGIRDQ